MKKLKDQTEDEAVQAMQEAIHEGLMTEEEAVGTDTLTETKTFKNTDASGAKENVRDIEFWGNGDTFKLIAKASSKNEEWMKSTKAMQVPTGCVIQVTTQQGDNIAEALTFVPGLKIWEIKDETGKVVSRTFK